MFILVKLRILFYSILFKIQKKRKESKRHEENAPENGKVV